MDQAREVKAAFYFAVGSHRYHWRTLWKRGSGTLEDMGRADALEVVNRWNSERWIKRYWLGLPQPKQER